VYADVAKSDNNGLDELRERDIYWKDGFHGFHLTRGYCAWIPAI